MAGTTFTGQNVGAHKLDRVKKGMYSALAMVLIYTVFIGTVLLLSSHQVLGLFTHNEEVIKYGQLAMKYFLPILFHLRYFEYPCWNSKRCRKGRSSDAYFAFLNVRFPYFLD